MNITSKPRIMKVGVRGFGGEIGDTLTRVIMGMDRGRFNRFHEATGGNITAFIRHKKDISVNETITGDRSFKKLLAGKKFNGVKVVGRLEDNTASSYGYTDHISEVLFDPADEKRVTVAGKDGRILNIDYRRIPDTNNEVEEFKEIDFLFDCTGSNLKAIKNEYQDPNLYVQYPNLTVLFSAPVKTVKNIPHHLEGLTLAKVAQLNATGSCSTHAGVDLIRYIRETIIEKLNLSEDQIIIDGGLFDSTHSLTPSDEDSKISGFYLGATVPQTTGFGGGAKKVFPVPEIGNIEAATRRYDSFFESGKVKANGISTFSLSMTISVKRGKDAVTLEMINQGLFAAAMDPEGSKHIGIINSDVFKYDENKKTGIFTTMSLSGMTPTAMLPLGDNIKVVKTGGYKTVDGKEYDEYIITVKNAGYDNRLGFTVDMIGEANNIMNKRLGFEMIPGFHHRRDMGDALAFIRTPLGQEIFAKALEKTSGDILVKPAYF